MVVGKNMIIIKGNNENIKLKWYNIRWAKIWFPVTSVTKNGKQAGMLHYLSLLIEECEEERGGSEEKQLQ